MIVLPTRKRLERRRNRLYAHLQQILQSASITQVENVMRQIHAINFKLRTYFQREMKHEPQEFFNEEEDYDITTKDTAQDEIAPTFQELAQIEAKIQAGEI